MACREDLRSFDRAQQFYFENKLEIENKRFCSAQKMQTNASTDVLILLGRKYTTGSNQLQFIKTLIKIISYQIFTIFNNFISNLYHLYKISVHLLAMSFVSICI